MIYSTLSERYLSYLRRKNRYILCFQKLSQTFIHETPDEREKKYYYKKNITNLYSKRKISLNQTKSCQYCSTNHLLA